MRRFSRYQSISSSGMWEQRSGNN